MNILKYQKKYPVLEQSDIFALIEDFRAIDVEDQGWVAKQQVIEHVSKAEGSYDTVRETMKKVSVDASGHVELDDYLELIAMLREREATPVAVTPAVVPSPGRTPNKTPNRIIVGGRNADTTHSINEEERTEFTRHINSILAGDPHVGDRLPFPTDSFQLFDECRDGLVLSKLINDLVPDTIDTRVLNFPKPKKPLNNFTMNENANIVINSAKAIGCVVVNVHSDDITEGKEHLILGLIWQIIRRGLLSNIDIKLHPELYRLLEDDETLEQFLRLAPEKILLRWFNYHLRAAGSDRRVANFSKDISDGENYTVLLHQLRPAECSLSPLKTSDLHRRAEEVLQNADTIGCRKYLTPTALVAGNPKLNLAFVAHLFNMYPGLEPIEESEAPEIEEFDAEGEREARVFTLWLNSLEVDPVIVSLFEDLKDGTILLQAFDKVIPGCVVQKRINKVNPNQARGPGAGTGARMEGTGAEEEAEADSTGFEGFGTGTELSRFKALENANYAVEVGKANQFSLVGIEGSDIVDGVKVLTLGLVWQLMRRNITLTLNSLSAHGKEMNDKEMLKWANAKANRNPVRSFGDKSLSNGIFLLDILHGLKPGYVDYDLVNGGDSPEEIYANARLAISIARKLGALIWLVPEDINEVRSRLILTFVGSLMSLEL